jgi:DNA repair exonuclease SbcCD ATPase subunit
MADNLQTLTIFEPKNVQTLAEIGPQSYKDNQLSHFRCLEVGRALLARASGEGMSDALDMEIAKYIEKSKVTLKKMNSRRTPVTQLFDQIRKAYTSMENEVDPAKASSIPNQLQALRNNFAKKKHEEEELRRRAEEARMAKENARSRYRADVEEDYVSQFNRLVNKCINELTDMDKQITLDNYEIIFDGIKNYSCELPADWCESVASGAYRPAELTPEECRAIQAAVMTSLVTRFKEQFPFEVQDTRDEIIDRMPSKKIELQRMAKASAEEAARIKAEMEARERMEAARKEQERLEKEKQEAEAAKLAAQKQEMDGLFGMPVATPAGYQPKTQVKKKVVVQSPEDIMAIVAFWWSQEGCGKTVEELSKEFKKQITFANAAANSKDNPMFIANVRYEDEVKAK